MAVVSESGVDVKFIPYLFDLGGLEKEVNSSDIESFLDSHLSFLNTNECKITLETINSTKMIPTTTIWNGQCDLQTDETMPDGLKPMKSFSPEKVKDWKHVMYNLLVDNYNSGDQTSLVQPCEISLDGRMRKGFQFNENMEPQKKLPELYAYHIRKARLDMENQNSVFVQDLYKFYLRACYQLLSQYFERHGQWIYLYADGSDPLFVPCETLEEAEIRLRQLGTRRRNSLQGARPNKRQLVDDLMD